MSTYLGIDIFPKFMTTTAWQKGLADTIGNMTGEKVPVSKINDLVKWEATMKQQMLPGGNPVVYLAANAKVSSPVAESYLQVVEEYRGQDVKKEGIFASIEKTVDVISAAGAKTAEGLARLPEGTGDLAKSLPWILGILAAGVAGYLVFSGRKGTNFLAMLPMKRLTG